MTNEWWINDDKGWINFKYMMNGWDTNDISMMNDIILLYNE